MAFPRKLATTIGIELTYMPWAHQVLSDEGAHPYSFNGYGAFADMLGHLLNARKVKVLRCGTDPSCVEVPTLPYDDVKKLRDVVRDVFKAAEDIGLTPVATYSIGGGAHIHTGIMGETDAERIAYRAHIAAWLARNPWLSWAFAGYTDDHNAQPVALEHICNHSARRMTKAARLADAEERAKNARERFYRCRENAAHYTNRLHTRGVWGDTWERRDTQRTVRNYQQEAGLYFRRWKDYAKTAEQIAAEPDPTTPDNPNLIPAAGVTLPGWKSYAITRRDGMGGNGTMEFRCFRMPDRWQDMGKLVAVANAVCKAAHKAAKASPEYVDVSGMWDGEEPARYSDMVRGFNTMLEGLGLNPEDYREYRVNMALRLRHRAGRRSAECKVRCQQAAAQIAREREAEQQRQSREEYVRQVVARVETGALLYRVGSSLPFDSEGRVPNNAGPNTPQACQMRRNWIANGAARQMQTA